MNMARKTIGIVMVAITLALLFATYAQAEDDSAPSVTTTLENFVCADLNKSQSGLMVTVLEENIGTEEIQMDSNTKIINCFRQTTCTKETGCKSEYYTLCTPVTNEVYCSRVQAIVSNSGISMLFSYIGMVYKWAAGVVGTISVMYLIYGGFMMITAIDNTANVDKAKEKIVQSLAGLAILFLSAIILYTINPNFFVL
jgi:hypothetical protein